MFPSRWDNSSWKIPWVFTIFLSLFAVCVTASYTFPGLLRMAQVTGAALAVIAALTLMRGKVPVVPEIGLFWLFVAWCAGTGIWKVGLQPVFLDQLRRLLYNAAIFFVVGTYCARRRSLAPCLFASAIVGLVMVAYGFGAGDFELASEISDAVKATAASRVASLTNNANYFGMLCFWGLAAVMSFWGQARSRTVRWFLLGCAASLVAGIVFSASRKAFLLVFVFALAWGWFCFRSFMLRNARVIFGTLAVLLFGYSFATTVLRDTFLGQRLRGAESGEDTSVIKRMELVRESVGLFRSNPISGIGLGQMKVRSIYGLYAHNEYGEVLATTGAVGGALYFAVYFLLWRRLRGIQRFSPDPKEYYAAGCCLAMLACYLVSGFALVSFMAISFFCLSSGWVGYAYGTEAKMKSRFLERTLRIRGSAGKGSN